MMHRLFPPLGFADIIRPAGLQNIVITSSFSNKPFASSTTIIVCQIIHDILFIFFIRKAHFLRGNTTGFNALANSLMLSTSTLLSSLLYSG